MAAILIVHLGMSLFDLIKKKFFKRPGLISIEMTTSTTKGRRQLIREEIGVIMATSEGQLYVLQMRIQKT